MKALPPHRLHGSIQWMFALAALLVLTAGLAMRFSAVAIWDDAWFYARYAGNLLDSGEYQWNPGTRAYGLTAPLYGLLVAAGRGLGISAGGVLWGLAFISGCVALALVYWHIRRHADEGGTHRALLRDLCLLVGAMNAAGLAAHMSSGMETTFAMLYLLAYLLLANAFFPRLSPGKALVLGAVGGLAWVIRPELLLFTWGLPLGMGIFSKKAIQRREAWFAALFTSAVGMGVVWTCMQQFGSLFPLSFYAKSLYAQDPALVAEYRWSGWAYFGEFMLMNALPAALIVGGLYWGRRDWWRFLALHERLLMVALGVFLLYQSVGVWPIMGYHARFLYPSWPVLIWLGARSAVYLLRFHSRGRDRLLAWRWQVPAAAGLSVLVMALGIGYSYATRLSGARAGFGNFDVEAAYAGVGRGNWPLLDGFSHMDDSLSVAATELGILGMMRPHATVYDLSGLHDPVLLHEGFDAGRLFEQQGPDLIYVPLPVYGQTRARLLAHPMARSHYHLYQATNAFTEVLLRKDSPVMHLLHGMDVQDSNRK